MARATKLTILLAFVAAASLGFAWQQSVGQGIPAGTVRITGHLHDGPPRWGQIDAGERACIRIGDGDGPERICSFDVGEP